MLRCTLETRERLYDALQEIGDVKASGPALIQLRHIASKIERCLLDLDERNQNRRPRTPKRGGDQ
jgi:hypothetical protein